MRKHVQKHDDEIIKLVQKQLGKDVNAEMIEKVALHMKECPDCHIYVDSVHQTINLIKNIDAHSSLPTDIKKRLFKSLKLGKN